MAMEYQCQWITNVEGLPMSEDYQCLRSNNVNGLPMPMDYQCQSATNANGIPMLKCFQCQSDTKTQDHGSRHDTFVKDNREEIDFDSNVITTVYIVPLWKTTGRKSILTSKSSQQRSTWRVTGARRNSVILCRRATSVTMKGENAVMRATVCVMVMAEGGRVWLESHQDRFDVTGDSSISFWCDQRVINVIKRWSMSSRRHHSHCGVTERHHCHCGVTKRHHCHCGVRGALPLSLRCEEASPMSLRCDRRVINVIVLWWSVTNVIAVWKESHQCHCSVTGASPMSLWCDGASPMSMRYDGASLMTLRCDEKMTMSL
jgi:hypothetical protein